VNLLIEPQLNPLKHIPWVSVSHKVLAGIWPTTGLHGFLLHRMNAPLANLMMAAIVTLTPGIFGFLIWELTENWRLFAANRPKNLRPVRIGAHGETLVRLMRPGFHSGTIPKRFAKLRRAERKALRGDDPGVVRKHREVLHHVEVDLQRYIEREFSAWFVEDRGWTCARPRVGEIRLATNDASVEVEMTGTVEGRFVMAFQFVDGRTILRLSGKAMAEGISNPGRTILGTSIINVLKTGGVEAFHCSSETMPADDASPAQEIGDWDISWPEWVATWEMNRDLRDKPPWSRLCVI
jgi:hypothetical protein